MSNADSDMKSFLASTECSDTYPIDDLITLVPLVQTLQDECVLKVNSFTDEGKIVWSKACGLEKEFKVLHSQFSNVKLHPDKYINGNCLLTSYNSIMLSNQIKWQDVTFLPSVCSPQQ